MPISANPKIYHIVHVDKLGAIANDGWLWSDGAMSERAPVGTVIGMNDIKQRRLNELRLSCHPDLFVGRCTPFYFCPRSVMLYLIHRRNAGLSFQGGQGSIVHLEADLMASIAWANANARRWAFTLSNAGAYYFEDRCDPAQLVEVGWASVATRQWSGPGVPSTVKDEKQSEFLMEHSFPWHLITRIGVSNSVTAQAAADALGPAAHRPAIQIQPTWYY